MMAGLAAAFGGFAKGYGEGAKLRSDLEDAEERRGLARAQKESLALENEKKQREAEYEKERKTLLEGIFNPKQEVETTAPPADQESLPEYERGQPGIKVPGQQQGMFSGANGASVNDLGTLTRLQNALTYLDAKHGKIGVKEMLEGAQRYKQLQNEGVMDAWQKVAAGDYEGAIQTFNSTGKFKLPEGTKFEARQEDDGFGAGRKITNYYAIAPDGREVNYRDMMRNTIAPEKLAEIDSATGYRIADLGLKRTAEQNAAQRHTEIYKLTELKYDRLIGEQQAQTRMALERLNLVKDDAKYQKTQGAFTGAFGELTNALGVNKRFDLALASEADKRDQAAKLLAASGAQSIFEMNYDLGKNAAGLTPQQSLNVWKQAAADPSIVKIDEETGFGYVEMGKKKVYVPNTMAPQSAPSQGGETNPPSRSASGAIRTPAPRAVDSDGTVRPAAPMGLRTPYGPQRYQPQSVTTPFNPD
jgi:hypothetical protein